MLTFSFFKGSRAFEGDEEETAVGRRQVVRFNRNPGGKRHWLAGALQRNPAR